MTDTSRAKHNQSSALRRMSRRLIEKDSEIQKLRMNMVDLTRIIGHLSGRLDMTIDLVMQLSDKSMLKEGAAIDGQRPQRGSSGPQQGPAAFG